MQSSNLSALINNCQVLSSTRKNARFYSVKQTLGGNEASTLRQQVASTTSSSSYAQQHQAPPVIEQVVAEESTTTTTSEPIIEEKPLFSKKEIMILESEKTALGHLLKIIENVEGSEEDIDLLRKSINQLEEHFLMVIVGEFNAGKSSFINAMLGDRYLREGITPTTAHLHVIRHGGDSNQKFDERNQLVNMELPLKWLKGISVVDTPGTNAIIKEHQTITETFVPRADLIIFLTSAERPFSESEHTFLEMIRKWGKKVVVCINKYDLLQNEKEQDEVEVFVRDGIIRLLGFEPKIFCVSARSAMDFKQSSRISSFLAPEERELAEKQKKTKLAENWLDLEKYVLDTLNSIERAKLKFLSPLGVAQNLSEKYLTTNIEERLKVLKEDKKTMEIIEEQLQVFYNDMKQDFELQQAKLENIFHELSERGTGFYDNFVNLSNISSLIKSKIVAEEFQTQVIANTATQIENHVSEVIDWIIDRKYRQWKAVTDFANKRARISLHEDKLVGTLSSDFQFNRKELLLKIGTTAENAVRSYDKEHNDTEKLFSEIASGLKATAAVEVSAITIGVSSALLMPTAAMAGAGVVGALMVGAGGLYALPYKRATMRKNFIREVNKLKEVLKQRMREEFERELLSSIDSIKNSITPYSRFVKAEHEKFSTQKERLIELQKVINQIRKEIESLQEADITKKM
ncbi:predicted protein [Naegleria gruberi]|uniref:Predicted protein n=1 Tax=Naegleria gruberi TaxID=5762 RepID=D2VW39_NAEGR|nr:uncharacterized protein NAEGRDRAFT_73238 [Naegleria gruberi]EFC38948.1 predicted protein [Naegleria gruberi]|eukprot:XP_002671692.1 predicted protein [Naegleria gruberi strain NEG-M]